MAILTLNKASGWTKVSEGEAQIQLRNTVETIAVLHSATAPLVDSDVEFIINSSGIEVSLGKTPCYVKVVSNGNAVIAVQDIS